MEILDAQSALNGNPAAGLLARKDVADIAVQLKQLRPDRATFIEGQLADLDASLLGKSAAHQFVEIDTLRDSLGKELLTLTQETQTARAFVAQRDAEVRAAEHARHDHDLFRARTTVAAQCVIKSAIAKLNGFAVSTLGNVAGPADFVSVLTEFESMLDSIKGSFAAAIAPHISADKNAA